MLSGTEEIEFENAVVNPTTTIIFHGRFVPESFAEFMRHRAGRLSLNPEFGSIGEERIEVALGGDGDLIDMFEMACSLGPIDCVVLDVERRDWRR